MTDDVDNDYDLLIYRADVYDGFARMSFPTAPVDSLMSLQTERWRLTGVCGITNEVDVCVRSGRGGSLSAGGRENSERVSTTGGSVRATV